MHRSASCKGWPTLARNALISGSLASLLSTLAISCCSRWQAGAASAGTNATSHWIWGDQAKHEDRLSLRHTAVGYGIHHASSVFWALLFESATRRAGRTSTIATAAATTAAVAYLVDYHAVPRRLTPGFRSRLSPGAMLAAYTAFAVGLGVGGWMRVRRQRHAPPRGLSSDHRSQAPATGTASADGSPAR